MTKKQPKEQEPKREAGPKFRSVIPESFRIRRPPPSPMADILRAAESPPDTTSHPVPESLADTVSHPDSASHTEIPPQALPAESHTPSASHTDTESPAENLAALAFELRYRKGNLRINFDYLDQVVGKLSRNARLLYIYLLRYREGSSNYTVRLNWPTLERKTDISRTVLHRSARELEAAGLAFSEGLQLGKGKEQGFRFRLAHTASHTVDGSLPDTASHADTADNNRKELTAKLKRDISKCPDCGGAGFFYPHGFDKGVMLCKHERLA